MAHALIIAMARVNGDPKYELYRHGKCMKKPVEDLLVASGVDLSNGGGLEELEQFQVYLSDYKIIMFNALKTDSVIFSGYSVSTKKLYLLYDSDSRHYNVITNLKAAMAKRYMCEACDSLYDNTHKCDKKCSQCTATPPCIKDQSKNCGTCNRWFLSEKCFQNHLVQKEKGSLVCQWKQICRKCNFSVTGDSRHECGKKVCTYCNKKQPLGHYCYVALLLPTKLSNKYLYVFFDTECTQDVEKLDGAFLHTPNLICAQQMCSVCQDEDDM
jgi:hypothetical protein